MCGTFCLCTSSASAFIQPVLHTSARFLFRNLFMATLSVVGERMGRDEEEEEKTMMREGDEEEKKENDDIFVVNPCHLCSSA